MKLYDRWFSARLGCEVGVARWGHYGRPVLVFPTAGGDAEEIERAGLVSAVWPLIEAGRIKLFSCDSVAGAAILRQVGGPRDRAATLNAFHDFVRQELVPAIRTDCRDPGIGIVSAGASIGAFNAVAVLCRYPDVFIRAIGMSGTYDIAPLVGDDAGMDLYFSTPLYFLPGLGGEQLEALRRRSVLLASGQGRWEQVEQSWRLAGVLGSKGIPNRVDAWGGEWDHDWPTWRQMLPLYLAGLG
ncbi:MAG TPA: alpha/beta hydrolase-fold protein [Candidatus Binatia bacterium]|nr:alpha/beta hydrolase-fold protein [Candidatus Binatia bacterium]